MPLAHHCLLDFYGCSLASLNDAKGFREVLLAAIAEAGGTYVTDIFHHFNPHGLSGVVVIAESHVALHTWPEQRFAAIDIFSCSPRLRLDVLRSRIEEWLHPDRVTVDNRNRGDMYPVPPATRADVAE